MRVIRFPAVLTGVLLGLAAAQANAVVCNLMLDANDHVIYQDVTPPVDLSDNGAAARAALRNRGNYLMVIDTDRCPRITTAAGPGDTGSASVDDIVGGMRPYLGNSAGGPSARTYVRSATSTSPATPAPARASTSGSGSSQRAY